MLCNSLIIEDFRQQAANSNQQHGPPGIKSASEIRQALGPKARVPPAPGEEREREAAVLRAIEALPGPGAALTRGDLQNALDNKWREANGAQQVKAG